MKVHLSLETLAFSFFFLMMYCHFSYNKLHLQMEELEQKHLHLLQVVESEKTAKWQYTQHCEELTEEIKKLRTEVRYFSFTFQARIKISSIAAAFENCSKPIRY